MRRPWHVVRALSGGVAASLVHSTTRPYGPALTIQTGVPCAMERIVIPKKDAGTLELRVVCAPDPMHSNLEVRTEPSSSLEGRRRTDGSEAWNPDREPGGRTQPLRDLQPLSAEEEVSLAEEYERRERAYWQALLSEPTLYGLIEPILLKAAAAPNEELPALAEKVREELASDAVSDDARWALVCSPLAACLRQLDVDRVLARTVHKRIDELADGLARARGAEVARPLKRRADRARSAYQLLKNEIVSRNLNLVVLIARRYRFPQMSLADLVQEGSLGLIKAVERFDYRFGFRFATYASWWIRHAIKRGVADKARTVRIPVHMVETQMRLARAKRALEACDGGTPSLRMLADATGLPERKIALAEELPSTHLSLDFPANREEGTSYKDLLASNEDFDPAERLSTERWLQSLPECMDCLGPLELQVLRWRFGLDGTSEMTLREIGDKFSLSRERIRQLQEQALAKLRDHMLEQDCNDVA
jgi:RNA polymerase primary sigma factor